MIGLCVRLICWTKSAKNLISVVPLKKWPKIFKCFKRETGIAQNIIDDFF